MTFLIVSLVIVALILAFVVIGKLQGVMKGLNPKSEGEEGPGKSNSVNGILFIVFGVVGLIAFVWSYLHAEQYFLPEASSVHGRRTDDLFWFSMGLLTIPFILVNGVLFFFAWKYQYKKNQKASFYPENHRLELIWTIVPAIVMLVLVLTGWKAWTDITSDAPADAEVIEITGKQFGWLARYGGTGDNKLGNYDFRLIDAQNEVGIDFTDESSLDDFVNPTELHIPAGRPVLLKIRARDVLHSVFIPHMRVKMDAVPGMPTKFWFVADKTTDQMRSETGNPEFNYEIACTEICGYGHFGMKMRLVVDDEKSYREWVASQPTFLSVYPEYLARVPANLKAKAAKYAGVTAEGSEEATASVVTE